MKKPVGLFGALLLVFGLIALAYQGFTYTQRETIVDIGPIHATADVERTGALPPVVGIVSVIAGVALIVAGQRQRG